MEVVIALDITHWMWHDGRMNEAIRTFKQQWNNDSADIEIRKGGEVTINGNPLQNHRERALANIILRLSAYRIINEEEKEKREQEKQESQKSKRS